MQSQALFPVPPAQNSCNSCLAAVIMVIYWEQKPVSQCGRQPCCGVVCVSPRLCRVPALGLQAGRWNSGPAQQMIVICFPVVPPSGQVTQLPGELAWCSRVPPHQKEPKNPRQYLWLLLQTVLLWSLQDVYEYVSPHTEDLIKEKHQPARSSLSSQAILLIMLHR